MAAHQQFKSECDINQIVARVRRGVPPRTIARQALYGDFSGVSDYRTALEHVRVANEAFMAIPAEIRLRFGNNPDQLHQFLLNPDNKIEAQRLGILPPDPVVEPVDKNEAEKTKKRRKNLRKKAQLLLDVTVLTDTTVSLM